MPPAGFEPTTSAGQPPQTHALGRVHTNRVESGPFQSSQILESLGVTPTESSPFQSSQTLESLGVTPTEYSPSLREFQWVFSTLWTVNN